MRGVPVRGARGRDLGDSVLWLGFAHARGRASDVELTQEISNHVTIQDGKIVRAQSYLSWQQGLEASRVSEKH